MNLDHAAMAMSAPASRTTFGQNSTGVNGNASGVVTSSASKHDSLVPTLSQSQQPQPQSLSQQQPQQAQPQQQYQQLQAGGGRSSLEAQTNPYLSSSAGYAKEIKRDISSGDNGGAGGGVTITTTVGAASSSKRDRDVRQSGMYTRVSQYNVSMAQAQAQAQVLAPGVSRSDSSKEAAYGVTSKYDVSVCCFFYYFRSCDLTSYFFFSSFFMGAFLFLFVMLGRSSWVARLLEFDCATS